MVETVARSAMAARAGPRVAVRLVILLQPAAMAVPVVPAVRHRVRAPVVPVVTAAWVVRDTEGRGMRVLTAAMAALAALAAIPSVVPAVPEAMPVPVVPAATVPMATTVATTMTATTVETAETPAR